MSSDQARGREIEDSDDDSDIQEVAVVPAKRNTDGTQSNIVKRRKSSPQMDPIPSYTPTPIHVLERRARYGSLEAPAPTTAPDPYINITYEPTPIDRTRRVDYSPVTSDSTRSPLNYDPLPEPSIVGRTIISSPEPSLPKTRSSSSRTQSTRRSIPPSSASAVRPVSAALAQAVASRRRSQVERPDSTVVEQSSAMKSIAAFLDPTPKSSAYAEQPVMWSPSLPSQILSSKDGDASQVGEDEDITKYTSPRMSKQRIAHKPTVPVNKNKRPKVPLGVSRKIPAVLRTRYLDVIINEYLNTGHSEDESYSEALKEEQAIANRANTKSIYINLVASLKKKLREKAGISTLPNEDPKYVNGNKVISHDEILTGKVIGTISIQRTRKSSDPAQLNKEELYDRLSRYVMPEELLEAYGYPSRDPENPELRKVPLGKDGKKQQLQAELAPSYICERCSKVYRIEASGMQLPTVGKCIYHPGHLWNERINRALEKRYSCCKGDLSAGGCSSNPYHVHKGELELQNYMGFVETHDKPELEPNKHGIYALDCEMCYTTYGLELTRVTVVDHKSDVTYEKLIKPSNPILDYNTKFSGIKPGDLDDITTSLADVQRDLLQMFSSKTILVGHSLDSDMKALKLFHKRFIDTAQLFPHKRGLPYKRALRTLMLENLSVIIQEDAGHDSKEDACAALRLVMWKAKTDVPEKAT